MVGIQLELELVKYCSDGLRHLRRRDCVSKRGIVNKQTAIETLTNVAAVKPSTGTEQLTGDWRYRVSDADADRSSSHVNYMFKTFEGQTTH